MRFIGLIILTGILLLPLWLLSAVVMPELTALQQTYAHLDETAQQVVAR